MENMNMRHKNRGKNIDIKLLYITIHYEVLNYKLTKHKALPGHERIYFVF